MPTPIYTPDNVTPAFQLRWSLAVFTRSDLPSVTDWWQPLQAAVEVDGVRLLEVNSRQADVWLFLISTQPQVIPSNIVKSVKGRLQHLIRPSTPDAFQRNFSLTSLGDSSRESIEHYVATQLNHHQMADPQIAERLAKFQLVYPEVNLSEPQYSSQWK